MFRVHLYFSKTWNFPTDPAQLCPVDNSMQYFEVENVSDAAPAPAPGLIINNGSDTSPGVINHSDHDINISTASHY